MNTPIAAPRTSIARQFARASHGTALIVLLLLSMGACLVGFHVLREQVRAHTATLAELMALQAEPAVLFRDEVNAQEIVSTISQGETLQRAEILHVDQHPMARQVQNPGRVLGWVDHIFPPPVIRRDVISDGLRIGVVEVEASNAPLLAALGGLFLAVLVVAAVLVVMSMLLATRYTRRIVQPLNTLQAEMRAIIDRGDYQAQVPGFAIREVEDLRLAFGDLLHAVARRDQSIQDANRVLEGLAFHDALTQLPNRAMYERAWLDAVHGARERGERVGVVYADLDGFKQINDHHGHDAGDAILIAVARRLRAWADDHALPARRGGDEFIILLRDPPDDQALNAQMQILRSLLEQPVSFGTLQLMPRVSLGWAIHPDTAASLEELAGVADHAMYRDKHQRHHQRATPSIDTAPAP